MPRPVTDTYPYIPETDQVFGQGREGAGALALAASGQVRGNHFDLCMRGGVGCGGGGGVCVCVFVRKSHL